MHQKIHPVTSLPLSLFSFPRIVVYTDISCVDTEVMLPLLVNLAILICLCVYVLIQQKMCLVHPLVATLGNISPVCKNSDSSFCLCVLELPFPCLGRGNLVGKCVQEELLESRTPSSQAGCPRTGSQSCSPQQFRGLMA